MASKYQPFYDLKVQVIATSHCVLVGFDVYTGSEADFNSLCAVMGLPIESVL